MGATRSILTPADVGEAVELSSEDRIWRKQILPMRTIRYGGRVINFDRKYLAGVADSWRRTAFDQVPVQLATAKNEHNNDPERFRGELQDVELASDGLYGRFKMSEKGHATLKENPKLGVSARLLEGYNRSDGETFGKAMQHVLLTLDPKLNGLKPWEAVSLSSEYDAIEILDLSGQDYEEDAVTETKATEAATEVVTLSADEYALFKEMADQHKAVLEFAADNDLDDDDDSDLDDELEDTTSSGVDPVILSTLEAQSQQILELSSRLAEADIAGEIKQLRDLGLAPAIVTAATPLLGTAVPEIELSNGSKLDVSGAVRHLLSTIIEMSNNGEAFLEFDKELGFSQEDSSDPIVGARNAMLDEWDRVAPIN